MELISLALAPTLIIIFYIYIRDKYEKEPWDLLFLGIVFGAVITAPIVLTEHFITSFMPNFGKIPEAFYLSFAVASFSEEGLKYIVLYFMAWRNKNFNEPYDGIVYAVFISLGFAGVENFLYVLNPQLGGVETALLRTVISVPGHAIFGVSMGYSFAFARFLPGHKNKFLVLAFLIPWIFHGIFDFLLILEISYGMVLFAAFLLFLWIYALRRIKGLVESSPFKYRGFKASK